MQDRDTVLGESHRNEGVGQDTRTYCPEAGGEFGPHPDAYSIGPHCPYCGGDTDGATHRVHDDGNEVYCPNTSMSTWRYCPFCGVNTDE